MLVGDQTAAMLGLDRRHAMLVRILHRALAGALRGIQLVMGPMAQPFQPLAPLSAKLGERVVQHLCLATDDGRPRQVEIPSGWR
jgi:hypothetical protein